MPLAIEIDAVSEIVAHFVAMTIGGEAYHMLPSTQQVIRDIRVVDDVYVVVEPVDTKKACQIHIRWSPTAFSMMDG